MKVPKVLEGSRLNVTRTAELFHMNVGHLRRLSRRGVLPAPRRTTKQMPYYDFDLLTQIGEVLRTGVGLNAEEVSFYRRKIQTPKKRKDAPGTLIEPGRCPTAKSSGSRLSTTIAPEI